mmetsp:Transcript_5995/g.10796  ORF Transcript_5995/g.10796 Transcript_5995/m.10796 type:complete len:140 (-) Transcript_5995:786-1205(-)
MLRSNARILAEENDFSTQVRMSSREPKCLANANDMDAAIPDAMIDKTTPGIVPNKKPAARVNGEDGLPSTTKNANPIVNSVMLKAAGSPVIHAMAMLSCFAENSLNASSARTGSKRITDAIKNSILFDQTMEEIFENQR